MGIIKLHTAIPHEQDLELIEELEKYEARSMHGQLPIVWSRSKDCMVEDRWGNRFLDFTSTICVTNLGHGNTDVCNALRSIINKPLLHSYTFATEIRRDYLKALVNRCYPGGKAFLLSSGTEATECAVKLMRLYSMNNRPYRHYIISFEGAMHGRTLAAERMKGPNESNRWAFADEPGGFLQLPVPTDKDNFQADLKELFDGMDITPEESIGGFMIESYQGWSAKFYPKEYIQDMMSYAKKNKIPVCFDEIQGGFGRTGKMFAFEHYGIVPDLICIGKGTSGSSPLSGVIGRTDIMNFPEVGTMSSTHSANPLACASGLAVLKQLDRKLIDKVDRQGVIIDRELSIPLYNRYGDDFILNGNGLVFGIVTPTEDQATELVWKCFLKGLLLIWTHRNSVKIAPPLTITDEALMEGLNIIKESI